MTNYERIKKMSKQEMAEFLAFRCKGNDGCYSVCGFPDGVNCDEKNCTKGVRIWLSIKNTEVSK